VGSEVILGQGVETCNKLDDTNHSDFESHLGNYPFNR
jgi:hypothetical protein